LGNLGWGYAYGVLTSLLHLMLFVVHDVITPFKFGDDRFIGFWLAEGQILLFPIDFEGRPYNTHTIMWGVILFLVSWGHTCMNNDWEMKLSGLFAISPLYHVRYWDIGWLCDWHCSTTPALRQNGSRQVRVQPREGILWQINRGTGTTVDHVTGRAASLALAGSPGIEHFLFIYRLATSGNILNR